MPSVAAQELAWVRQFGTEGRDSAGAVTTDAVGHVYVAGSTAGSFPDMQSAGGVDAFLAQYDTSGRQLWVRQFGSAANESFSAVSATPYGQVFVAGGSFVARYDEAGNQLWLQRIEFADASLSITGLAADATGVYVGGRTFGAANSWLGEGFIARYDTAGNQVWVRRLPGTVSAVATGDGAGDLYVAGSALISTPTSADGFIARYDTGGSLVWSRSFITPDSDFPGAIAVDAYGHVYVTGVSGSMEPELVFLLRYDTFGNHVWTRAFEDSGTFPPELAAVVADSSGNAYVVGGGSDSSTAFVAKYDATGFRRWKREFTSGPALAAAIDEQDRLYIAGRTAEWLNAPPADAFLAKVVEPTREFVVSDVGDVGAGGSAEVVGTRVTVHADGRDVWGTADAFSWISTAITGDFDAVVRVAGVEYVHDWTKAGLMIRADHAPDAAHMFLLATPAAVNGVAFQRRRAPGGETEHTAGPPVAPPVWLKLSRRGPMVYAWARTSVADPWVLFGAAASEAFGPTVFVGLAVTSHREGVPAEAAFEDLAITVPPVLPFTDVGDVGATGSADFDGSTYIVRGGGADIWSTTDAFGWTYAPVTGDFDATVQVTSIDATHEWAKAGLMIRPFHGASAPHLSLFATPVHGVAFQRRLEYAAVTAHTPGPSAGAPVWLKLSRRGDTVFAAYRLRRTDPWTLIAVERTSALRPEVLVGLAVTSHAYGTLATATFEHVDIVPVPELSSADVGSPTLAGSVETEGATIRITASGDDIWAAADAFHYLSTHLGGDGVITARVLSMAATHRWAKAGVMIRQSLDPGATHVMTVVSAAEGVSFQYRDLHGGRSWEAGRVSGAAPAWVRLSRRGDDILAETSVDGVWWTPVGSLILPMSGEVYVGLVLTSHDGAAVAEAVFDDVSIRRE